MARIDYTQRLIDCKIVYCGPHGSGKTANLRYIWEKTSGPKSEFKRIPSADPNASYYDYLPIGLGEIRGFKIKFHLYTVPGSADYATSRSALLEAVDGIVFVADSERDRLEENAASLAELTSLLAQRGFALGKLSRVAQFNKRDLATAAPKDQLAASLSALDAPIFEAIATRGIGVFDSLKEVAKQVLTELKKAST